MHLLRTLFLAIAPASPQMIRHWIPDVGDRVIPNFHLECVDEGTSFLGTSLSWLCLWQESERIDPRNTSREWRSQTEKERKPLSKFLLWAPGVDPAGDLRELSAEATSDSLSPSRHPGPTRQKCHTWGESRPWLQKKCSKWYKCCHLEFRPGGLETIGKWRPHGQNSGYRRACWPKTEQVLL